MTAIRKGSLILEETMIRSRRDPVYTFWQTAVAGYLASNADSRITGRYAHLGFALRILTMLRTKVQNMKRSRSKRIRVMRESRVRVSTRRGVNRKYPNLAIDSRNILA